MDYACYELQVHDGSSWQVKRRYYVDEEAEAIAEAARLARSLKGGTVRVVFEIFDARIQRFVAKTVYRNGNPDPPPAMPATARKPAADRFQPDDFRTTVKTDTGSDTGTAAPKAAAGDSRSKELAILIGIKFFGSYSLSAVVCFLAYRAAVIYSGLVHDSKSAFIFFAAMMGIGLVLWMVWLSRPERSLLMGGAILETATEPADPPPGVAPAPAAGPSATAAARRPRARPPAADAPDAPEAPPDDQAQPAPPEIDALAGARELVAFARRLVDVAAAEHSDFATTATQFACHVFIAGLCDAFAAVGRWPRDALPGVLAEALAGVATSAEQTAVFCRQYRDYLATSMDVALFNNGQQAVRALAEGSVEADRMLTVALTRWKQSLKKPDNSAFSVVMFTDIVGSTEFTQQHGDAAQMSLVLAHDGAVETAAARFGGRIVKHTGDGMMVSFAHPAAAMQAAIAIQMSVAAQNNLEPDLDLKLRIGINAGTAIRQDGDFFGSAIQLAARMCSVAQAGEIAATRAVVEGCAGTGLTFRSAGAQMLKGFPEPIEIFFPVFSTGSAAAPRPAAAPAAPGGAIAL